MNYKFYSIYLFIYLNYCEYSRTNKLLIRPSAMLSLKDSFGNNLLMLQLRHLHLIVYVCVCMYVWRRFADEKIEHE